MSVFTPLYARARCEVPSRGGGVPRGRSRTHRAIAVKLRGLVPVINPVIAVPRVPAAIDQVHGSPFVIVGRVRLHVSGRSLRDDVALSSRVTA